MIIRMQDSLDTILIKITPNTNYSNEFLGSHSS